MKKNWKHELNEIVKDVSKDEFGADTLLADVEDHLREIARGYNQLTHEPLFQPDCSIASLNDIVVDIQRKNRQALDNVIDFIKPNLKCDYNLLKLYETWRQY